MRIRRASDYRRMPWKNGGGETTEIAISPEGAALDAFDWRVSMARVASDGPFSLFPTIDRTLAVLSGNGIRLRVDGIGIVDLTQASAPFAFPADAASSADLLDGPIDDLNVMSRRGKVRHSLTRQIVNAPMPVTIDGDTVLLLIYGGDADIRCGSESAPLAAGDSVVLQPSDAEALLLPSAPLSLYRASFRPA